MLILRRIHLILAAAGVLAATAATSFAQQSPPVLRYFAQRAAQTAAQLPPLPQSADAWEKYRGQLVADLSRLLGLPQREPMKAGVTYTSQQGDLVVEEVTYLWAEKTYASATVVRAKDVAARRCPAIVFTSGWLGNYRFRPYREVVEQLARSGCVVLFIDDPRTGKRHAPSAGLYVAASAAGTSAMGIQTFDALRALDYLLTRADVDPGKIGIAGLGEGAIQAWLAAAMEPRFQFVVACGGTTTYEALIQAAAAGEKKPDDPSVFVPGILGLADLDRVAACAAPRPVLIAGSPVDRQWPAAGRAKVLATMKAVYKLYQAEERIQPVRGKQSDDFTPYAAEIATWLESQIKTLKGSDAAPAPCAKPDEPDYSMLGYAQRRVADGAKTLPAAFASRAAWQAYRLDASKWLRETCRLDTMKPGPDKVVKVSEKDGLVFEQLQLGLDGEFTCPAVLVHPAADKKKHAAVILSHDDRQCAASPKIQEAARRLAAAGCWVIVPEHVSAAAESAQPLKSPEEASFYGDDAAGFCGLADLVGLPPLVLRVADDLAALHHLTGRADVDPARITAAGLGLGGVDACLAAVLEDRIAGVASIDATTVRDWVANQAPGAPRLLRIPPCLPAMLPKTDLDFFYGAIAPRPLVAVRLKDGWSKSGFEQVSATAQAVYKLDQAEAALSALGPRDANEALEQGTPEGTKRHLVVVARALVPTPPTPGLVGNAEGLKSRAAADSASGLFWIVAELSGYDQQFTEPGYRLKTWSFFNDNGASQKGFCVTPLIFKKDGDSYKLTGIGKTRTNAGTGAQTFAFEAVEGTDEAGDGYVFGWYDGAGDGTPNAGVVEFDEAPDCRMVILGGSGQNLKIGQVLREQSAYPRRYSIAAEAKK
jgi:dienelactone hydrolase